MTDGIKETKEVVIAINELAVFIASRLKDGAGLDDAIALFEKVATDSQFKMVLAAAVENIGQVPAELKALDLAKDFELVGLQVSYLPKTLAALKKDA